MRRFAALLLGLTLALPAFAQTIVHITAVPTPAGVVSSKFRDGDDGGAAGPSTPELGNPQVISDTVVDLPLQTPSMGGTAPLVYELSTSTTDAVSGFSVVDANADFGEDGVYTLTGLTAETAYWAQLAAIDDDSRRSGNSQVRSFTTLAAVGGDATPPSDVTGLVTSSTVAGEANVSWNAATDNVGVVGYQIVRGIGDGAGNPVGSGTVIVASHPSTTFTDTGLTPGSQYYYRIRALDAAGNLSTTTTARSFVTIASAPDVGTPLVGETFETLPLGFVYPTTNSVSMELGGSLNRATFSHSGQAPTVVVDPDDPTNQAVRFRIPGNTSGGDSSTGRSELAVGKFGVQGTSSYQNVEQCFGYRLRLDEDFLLTDSVNVNIPQFNSDPDQPGDNPSLSVVIDDNAYDYRSRIPAAGSGINQSMGRTTAADRGVWRRWVLHVKWNNAGAGWTKVYVDGVLEHDTGNISTVAAGTTSLGKQKIGMYSAGCKTNDCSEREALFDDFRGAEGADCPEVVDPANW